MHDKNRSIMRRACSACVWKRDPTFSFHLMFRCSFIDTSGASNVLLKQARLSSTVVPPANPQASWQHLRGLTAVPVVRGRLRTGFWNFS